MNIDVDQTLVDRCVKFECIKICFISKSFVVEGYKKYSSD